MTGLELLCVLGVSMMPAILAPFILRMLRDERTNYVLKRWRKRQNQFDDWNRYAAEARKESPNTIRACYLGEIRTKTYPQEDMGVLKFVNYTLTFTSMSDSMLQIPLDTVRWIQPQDELSDNITVYVETHGEWSIYHFRGDNLGQAACTLSIPIAHHPDFGPTTVRQREQKMSGVWNNGKEVTLYLLPDRLLCDWHDFILISQIRGLTVIPTTKDTGEDAQLEIEATTTFRFEMTYAQARVWVRCLSKRRRIPVKEAEIEKRL